MAICTPVCKLSATIAFVTKGFAPAILKEHRMTLKRWGIAFLQLGALLAAIGLGPLIVMGLLFPNASPLVPVLLSLTVAPLGGLSLVIGLSMWLIGLARQ